jgi:hypothetical protein
MEIMAEEIRRMKEYLNGITDNRQQWGHLLHHLKEVLVIALVTILAGWDEYTVMEKFDKAKENFLDNFWNYPMGSTLGMIFTRIKPAELMKWLVGVSKGEAER